MSSGLPFNACRQVLPESFKRHFSDICASGWPDGGALPVVYSEAYNISWLGLQNLSSLDSCKPRHIVRYLQAKGLLPDEAITAPLEATDEALLQVHDANYLTKLKTWNLRIAQMTEIPSLVLLPNSLLQRIILSPLRHQAAGTMLAAALAVERGWAINLGGGFHHCCWNQGRAWCAFADITLAVRRVREASQGAVQRVLLLDLDAHQGNGVQRDKLHVADELLTIIDLHAANVFPRDDEAMQAIDVQVVLPHATGDQAYLWALQGALQQASSCCPRPDLIMCIAGADVLADDPSGRMALTPAGLAARDELVFSFALKLGAPVCMVLGGGNMPGAAQAVAGSIANLFSKFRLGLASALSPSSSSSASAKMLELSSAANTLPSDSAVP